MEREFVTANHIAFIDKISPLFFLPSAFKFQLLFATLYIPMESAVKRRKLQGSNPSLKAKSDKGETSAAPVPVTILESESSSSSSEAEPLAAPAEAVPTKTFRDLVRLVTEPHYHNPNSS